MYSIGQICLNSFPGKSGQPDDEDNHDKIFELLGLENMQILTSVVALGLRSRHREPLWKDSPIASLYKSETSLERLLVAKQSRHLLSSVPVQANIIIKHVL
mmetsp:Transcript_11941/g.28338  ORF Transcript_11941/g.28338 Transcript_11941/m.28338 type:complete len:101 (+) Transcript_11941:1759-2061(+)